MTVTVKAAGSGEVEAERGLRGTPRAAAGAAAAAPAGVAAGAGREARTGPARRGSKSAESEKKVTRGGGKLALLPDVSVSWRMSWHGRSGS